MTEKLVGFPLALSNEMIESVLSGEKVHTIRALNQKEYDMWENENATDGRPVWWCEEDQEWYLVPGPYGEAGEGYLWIRESYRELEDGSVEYRAIVDPKKRTANSEWAPVVGMPERHSRAKLMITGVRFVPGVQQLTKEDIIKDGFITRLGGDSGLADLRKQYRKYWNKRYRNALLKWKANPAVWICEFEIVEAL
jgi:hypothetical protein